MIGSCVRDVKETRHNTVGTVGIVLVDEGKAHGLGTSKSVF
jgi:hypothetical protein